MINHKIKLKKLILDLNKSGKLVYGYGASTKGNVILQFCKINNKIIESIIEINEKKFNCFTPGTNIKIINANKKKEPDYMLVLPWHFRDNIINKREKFFKKGGN